MTPPIDATLKLLNLAEAGQMERLPCPACGMPTISVWHSNPIANRYFTWFVCEACGNRFHANNSERPRHFSEERRCPECEALDRDMLNETDDATRKAQ